MGVGFEEDRERVDDRMVGWWNGGSSRWVGVQLVGAIDVLWMDHVYCC